MTEGRFIFFLSLLLVVALAFYIFTSTKDEKKYFTKVAPQTEFTTGELHGAFQALGLSGISRFRYQVGSKHKTEVSYEIYREDRLAYSDWCSVDGANEGPQTLLFATTASDEEARIHVWISGYMSSVFRIAFLDVEPRTISAVQLDLDELPIGKRVPILCFLGGKSATSISPSNVQKMIEGNPLAVVVYVQITPQD